MTRGAAPNGVRACRKGKALPQIGRQAATASEISRSVNKNIYHISFHISHLSLMLKI